MEAPVFIAVNGGYRSPPHRHSAEAVSPHSWACAANIYRIGDTWLDDEKSIERYRKSRVASGPEVRTSPTATARRKPTTTCISILGT